MKNYKTRQRLLIYNIFSKNGEKFFTAEDLLKILKDENVNKSTIYRNLEKLVSQNRIIKRLSEHGKSAIYKLNKVVECSGHLHLLCSKCGNVIHLSSEDSEKMNGIIKGKYGFLVNEKNTTMFGLCGDCAK